MNKHEMREEVFKIIFGIDFHDGEDIGELVEKYMTASCDVDVSSREYGLIAGKAEAVGRMLPQLDSEIDAVAEGGWKTNRMGKAELNIIRLALYEMKYDDSIPVKVAINEAVELSKEYCNDDARSFINGLLAHFV
ncbi:MAG: transcription antitermination factor NusB [Eubacteriales bacterium]|nr:transcription antitermination factor NusB [Eubacteriales bacterium]